MKRIGQTIGVVALLLALGTAGNAAGAQEESVVNPFALKIGTYFATEEDARRAGGSGMLLLEADYTFQAGIERDALTYTRFSVGYTTRRDLSMIPVTISQVFRNPNLHQGLYYGAGLGIYFVDMDAPDTSGKYKNLFGGFAVAGLDIGTNLFAEAKYHLISFYDRKNISGFQLAVGMRF